jgi:hypothetical protein
LQDHVGLGCADKSMAHECGCKVSEMVHECACDGEKVKVSGTSEKHVNKHWFVFGVSICAASKAG